MDKTKKQTGIELIAQERKDQIEKHGHTLKNDRGKHNKDGELIDAAVSLLIGDVYCKKGSWVHEFALKTFCKLNNSTETLTEYNIEAYKIAGALIAAEIDRLQGIEE